MFKHGSNHLRALGKAHKSIRAGEDRLMPGSYKCIEVGDKHKHKVCVTWWLHSKGKEQPVTWWSEVCAWLLGAAERVLMILAMLPTTPLLPSFCSMNPVFTRMSNDSLHGTC